jgi:uncharacterized membrane protein
MQQTSQRVEFLDLLRGIAVVIMVMGHSIDAVLSAAVRSSELFRAYDSLRGFTAPIFLFIAGFSFAVATERKWDQYRFAGPLFWRRVGRMMFLLALGYLLHLPFFSLNKLVHAAQPDDLSRMFQVDVLHCLAVTTLLLQALVMTAPTPRVFARRTAVLAAAVALLAPLFWNVDMASIASAPLAPFFNQREATIFPFFPFAAFLMAGTVAGHGFLSARAVGQEQRYFTRLAVAGMAAVLGAAVIDRIPVSLYPPHDYWKASPDLILLRLGIVLAYVTIFSYLRNIPSFLNDQLVSLGRASLPVYVVHLMVVYGSVLEPGLMQRIGQTLPPPSAVAAALGVLAAMTLLARGWSYVRTHHTVPSRLVQAGLATGLVYMFLTRPY